MREENARVRHDIQGRRRIRVPRGRALHWRRVERRRQDSVLHLQGRRTERDDRIPRQRTSGLHSRTEGRRRLEILRHRGQRHRRDDILRHIPFCIRERCGNRLADAEKKPIRKQRHGIETIPGRRLFGIFAQ